MFVGRLTHLKGLQLVLEVLAQIKNDHSFLLIIVGDGHERARLQAYCKAQGLEQRVCFVGYKQQSEIIYYLSLGDVFVFPTLQEVWGLVVNEALACGEYVISSTRAGATYDLITGPEVGVAVDPFDRKKLRSAIVGAIRDFETIQSHREARSLGVQQFSAEKVAAAIVEGLARMLDIRDLRNGSCSSRSA
jgi:glycosyltransferase involved in cell wall biosynthesis